MADAQAQRIAALEAELAAVRTEMQDLTYAVSHDLRASLRHVLSYAQLVQEDASGLLPPETLGFVHTIADSARHMGLLMDGLMELSRVGMVAVQLAPLALEPLLHDLVAERQAQHPGCDIVCQLPNALPEVLADASLLRAAMAQVLDNAVKFTAHRAQRQIAVQAEPQADGHGLHLWVADNGAGFDPRFQAKLFKPFSRLHTTKQFPGVGMGLALVRKTLQRMDAEVRAEGQLDAGCRVCIRLRCR